MMWWAIRSQWYCSEVLYAEDEGSERPQQGEAARAAGRFIRVRDRCAVRLSPRGDSAQKRASGGGGELELRHSLSGALSPTTTRT